MSFPKSTIFLMVQFSYILSNTFAFKKNGNDTAVTDTPSPGSCIKKEKFECLLTACTSDPCLLRLLLSLCSYAYEHVIPCKKIQKRPRASKNEVFFLRMNFGAFY